MDRVLKCGLVAYTFSSLVPFIKADAWWVRVWDFPRLQLAILGAGLGIFYFVFTRDRRSVKILVGGSLCAGLAFDLYRILPYSPIWKIESLAATGRTEAPEFSLLIANVLQENRNTKDTLRSILEADADIVFLVEVNDRWLQDLAPLREQYRFFLEEGLENKYGIAFYSRLRIEEAAIEYLVEPDVPSVRARMLLSSGAAVELFGVHPRPPRPQSGPSTDRDAELVKIAKQVRDQNDPVVVIGDFNDVAWSHTTRLFRRISGLLDPRVGRGPYPTFPAAYPALRFPLDYVFHSDALRLVSINRLEANGSDHLPMFAKFSLEPSLSDEQNTPVPKEGDFDEAAETIRREREGERD